MIHDTQYTHTCFLIKSKKKRKKEKAFLRIKKPKKKHNTARKRCGDFHCTPPPQKTQLDQKINK